MFETYRLTRKTTQLLLTLALCGTLDSALANNKVVAKVNGKEINEAALFHEINKKLPQTSFHSQVSPEKLQEFRKAALQKLIEDELFFQAAQKQKIAVELLEIEQQIAFMKKGYASEKAFQQAMSKSGYNALKLMKRVERSLMIKKIQQKEIFDRVTITDSEIREYYQNNQSKFLLPQQFRLRHILISVKPGAMAKGWQAGLEEAQKVYERIQAGENFAELAAEVSADSSSREAGGDIGWFHKGQLIPELEKALGEIQIGDVSPPVRSIYGFHLIKFEEARLAKQLTFEEINQKDLKQKLYNKKIESRRQEFLSELKSQAQIQIMEP
ncbi:MAG: peptidylprolyl isomerase [bacterium]